MAKKIVIGGMEFKTQSKALQFFKEMLGRYRDFQYIEGDDEYMLYALIERHPEVLKKIGCGIKKFYKAPTDKGTSCFWFDREDGSKTDFSYISAVTAKGKSLYQEFAEACREAVYGTLKKAKEKHFQEHANSEGKVPCDITGEMLLIEESHLDHKNPMTFEIIVRTFLKANKIIPTKEMLSAPADAQFVTTFIDKEIEQKFIDYHNSVADLRVISVKKNLSLGGSERITKPKRPVQL